MVNIKLTCSFARLAEVCGTVHKFVPEFCQKQAHLSLSFPKLQSYLAVLGLPCCMELYVLMDTLLADQAIGFSGIHGLSHCHSKYVTVLQLLHHGADVHNHGIEGGQRPLCLAVRDLNMDKKIKQLLVAYGASPFLAAKDGMHSAFQQCHAKSATWSQMVSCSA